MAQLHYLAQRLFNTPLAIDPRKAEVVVAALADRLGVAGLSYADNRPRMFDDPDYGPSRFAAPKRQVGYDVVEGIAVVPVIGTLVQKSGSVEPVSGMTGYDVIRTNIAAALADGAVRGIMLDIDSPGGEVAGCFDLVDGIYAARQKKPFWAALNETACSSAYAIASAANVVSVPRTGLTGSVGVIMMHVEWSKALAAGGVAVTVIQYGDRKADGADNMPLSDAAFQRFQANIDTMGELFVATVARNRGLSPDAVRGQQAMTYLGEQGLAAGLADAVMPPDEAFAAFLTNL